MSQAIVTDTLVATVRGDTGNGTAKTQLAYEPNDPYAVYLLFPEADEGYASEWAFGRELLESGLYRLSGERDVRVWPGVRAGLRPGWFVHVELRWPGGSTQLTLPRDPVRSFLLASYQAVPPGRESEHLDVDRAIAVLLGGA